MWSITLNIFKLIKIFIDIVNNKYYMVVGAKYDSSIMNDVADKTIQLTLSASLQKLYSRPHSFSKRK